MSTRTLMPTLTRKAGACLRRGISTRGALGISLILHMFLGIGFASLYVGKQAIVQLSEEARLEFDLVTDTELKFEKNLNRSHLNASLDGFLQQNAANRSQMAGVPAAAAPGKAASRTKAAAMDRKTFLMASLSSLSELRESFNFVLRQVSADSIGVFSPVQGEAPNVETLAAGLRSGYGLDGRGGAIISSSGGGNCPGGGVLK